ncbi:MAG: cation diffusion facilitator family transporter [Actinomycetes bacterium]
MQDGSKKAIVAAFGANLGIAIAKFTGFALTRSTALLAEAVHSLADTGNQGLLLLGSKRAQKKPDSKSEFGYGRERYFWSFVVALVLFSVGGLFALYEGIQKFSHPHETKNIAIAISILGVAILLEAFSLLTALREIKHVKKPEETLRTFIRSTKQPELVVVFFEDIGAEIGLILALAGVMLGHYTHEPRWDAVGSILIGALLIVIASILTIKLKSHLIGEAASPSEVAKIQTAITGHDKVLHLIHLRTEHVGPEELIVAAKVDIEHSLTIHELSTVIDEVEARIRAVVPIAHFIFIEPDISQ